MIQSNLVNQENGCKAVVTWQFDAAKKQVSNLCKNEEMAIAFCEKSIRKLIIETVTKFVNQKSYIQANCSKIVPSNSIMKLRSLIALLPTMNLRGVCKSIIIYENDLIASLPSEKSKFYIHDHATIIGLINDCKNILNNNKAIA